VQLASTFSLFFSAALKLLLGFSQQFQKCAQIQMFLIHCTEVRFASFLSGGFITAIVVNPPKGNWQNAPICIVGA
jgi:hypothetical protein